MKFLKIKWIHHKMESLKLFASDSIRFILPS